MPSNVRSFDNLSNKSACASRRLGSRDSGIERVIADVRPDGKATERLVDSAVTFARLSREQCDAALDGGEWQGKAGGYAIQGGAAALIRFVSGSYSNVVGLPLFETAALLAAAGVAGIRAIQ